MQLIATVPFLGATKEVYLNPKSWSKLKFDGQKFVVNNSVGTNFDKLNLEFNNYCQRQLKSIINSQIARLRGKNIDLELMYTDGVKNFPKKVTTSVDKYLKEIGYASKIDYKIGKYEKEWGINEINPKNKTFTLYFNQDLIKYDNGPHIEYVVAHELTHVFHRDHGQEFNQSLSRLFPRKRTSEEFFKSGISKRFNLPNIAGNKNFSLILIAITSLILIYFLGQFIIGFFGDLFSGWFSTTTKTQF